jgi:hypothetical protein
VPRTPAAAPLALLSATPSAAAAVPTAAAVGDGEHGAGGRAHRGPDRRRAHATRVPRPVPTSPIDLAPLAAAAGAGGASGPGSGTPLAIALVAALLLGGSAGPYELVALLRRRAPAGVGGRLERPG